MMKTSVSLFNIGALGVRWFLVMVFPILLFFFHEHHTMLPMADGAHYVRVAMFQYELFDNGFWEGIKGLYTFRSPGQRPLLYPAFIAVIMKIVGGDLYATTKYVQVFFAAVWSIYTYRLIRLYGDETKAICGAFLIVGWPSFFQSHYSMFSESCHLTLLFATLYYLLASDFLEKKSEVIKAGIAGAFTLCVRPELLFIIPVGLSYFIYHYLKKEKNFVVELLLNLPLFLAFFITLYARYVNITEPERDVAALWGIVAVALIFCGILLYKNHTIYKKKIHLFIFSSILISLTCLWYIPYVDQLYRWFLVGYYNLQDYNNPVADFHTNWKLVYPAWRALFWFLFALSLFAVCSEKYARKNDVNVISLVDKYGQMAIIGSIICLIYFILLVMKSAGITPLRRTDPGSFSLMIGLLILTASATVPLYKRIVNGTLVTVTLAMFVYSLSAFLPIWKYEPLEKYAHFVEHMGVPWQPVVYNLYPNADFNLVNAITETVKQHHLEGSDIKIASFTHWPPDLTLGLDIAQAKVKPPYTLGLWYIYNDSIKNLSLLKKQGTAYLLVDSFPEWTDEQVKAKIGFHFYPGWEVLYKLRHGDLQSMKLVDTIKVNGRVYSFYRL